MKQISSKSSPFWISASRFSLKIWKFSTNFFAFSAFLIRFRSWAETEAELTLNYANLTSCWNWIGIWCRWKSKFFKMATQSWPKVAKESKGRLSLTSTLMSSSTLTLESALRGDEECRTNRAGGIFNVFVLNRKSADEKNSNWKKYTWPTRV